MPVLKLPVRISGDELSPFPLCCCTQGAPTMSQCSQQHQKPDFWFVFFSSPFWLVLFVGCSKEQRLMGMGASKVRAPL